MERTLVVEAVSKRFGGRTAVHEVSFAVRPGVVTGLIGPNGAGKTTTMRMILDIIRPDSGEIRVLGHVDRPAVRRRLGYLPEERGLYMKMRVRDLLVYFARLRGLGASAARAAASRWLTRLELVSHGDATADSLSKGLAQRVQFGCALVHDPEVAILDEPMTGLDPIAGDLIRDLIVTLARTENRTVLLSTHDLAGAERLCEDLVMIDRGRVVLHGETAEIKARYGRPTVAVLFRGSGEFLRTHPAVARLSLYGGYADIELAADADVRGLVQDCARRMDEIQRIERVEPSLAEIFRRTVAMADGQN